MFVVIADGKPVFSTDIDDLAWEQSQELEGKFENVSVEEMYVDEFDENGNYETSEGFVISLKDIANAEQYYCDEDMRPTV